MVLMTHTCRPSRSRTRFVITTLTSCTLLAAGAIATATPVTSAEAPASPMSNQQRTERPGHRIVHHDARRDVLLFNEEDRTSTPAPRDRATDIVTTVVDHRLHRIVLRSSVRELSRSGYRLMIAEILTRGGRRYQLVVDYSRSPIDSHLILERFGSGAAVRCPGASWSIDRSANRIGAAVPSSCIGGPAWVRVGVALVAAPHGLGTSRADDSRSRGRVGDRHLELGPRQPAA